MRNVLFRCDAGREDGLGHLMRCLVLADACRDAGIAARFCVGGDAHTAMARVTQRGYAAVPADQVGTPDDVAQLEILPRDVLVLDSRRATTHLANQLAQSGFTVCIDDAGIADLAVDMLVNSNLDADAARYPGRAERRHDLLGPAFNLIDPRFFAAKPLRDRAGRLLLTFGGEDPSNHSLWAIERLAPAFGDMRVSVVIGPAHPDPASVASAAAAHAIEAIHAPPTMLDAIAAADLAISAGGTTCYELAAAGVPTLAIAIEPHQEPLIETLAQRGACTCLGAGFAFNIEGARATLRRYATDAAARRHMHLAQKHLFAEPGAPHIVRRIQQAYGETAT